MGREGVSEPDCRVGCGHPDHMGRAGVSGWRLAGVGVGVEGGDMGRREVPRKARRDPGAWDAQPGRSWLLVGHGGDCSTVWLFFLERRDQMWL